MLPTIRNFYHNKEHNMRFTIPTLIALSVLAAAPAMAAEKYSFDKSHTRVLFYVNHLGFSEMVGDLSDYDGSFTFDQAKPETSSIDVSIKPKGIHTSSAKLDDELQGEKFFNTAKFP